MAIRLLDRRNLHQVEIDGTIFHVRLFDWGQYSNWEAIAFKLFPKAIVNRIVDDALVDGTDGGKRRTTPTEVAEIKSMLVNQDQWLKPAEYENIVTMLVSSVEKVDGFDNMTVDQIIRGMTRIDILSLGSKIYELTTIGQSTAGS